MNKMMQTVLLSAFTAIFCGIVPTDLFAQPGRKSTVPKTINKQNGRGSKTVGKTVEISALPTTDGLSVSESLGAVKKTLPTAGAVGNNYWEAREDDEVKSGAVVVKVTSNGNATVKLGMSAMGVTMIEFPANDPIYEIHRNELYSDFVTVSCRRTETSGRCLDNPTDALILRPGKDFRASNNGGSVESSTVITVQRLSGMVVTFVIIPVDSISKNANHVVVTYPVDQIVKDRRFAGLAVNLASPSPPLVNNPLDQNGTENTSLNLNTTAADLSGNTSPPGTTSATSPNNLENLTVDELQRIGKGEKLFRFNKPVHGLSVAVAPNDTRLTGRVIDVFAVRNTLNVPVRLVPDMPELYVETQSKKGVVNSTRLSILHVATTAAADNILQPGETYFFSIVYDVPILGAKQSLRVGFAQTNAADEPSAIELAGLAR